MLMLDDAWFTCCALHNLLLEFDDELEPGDREDDEADQGIGLENEVDMLNASESNLDEQVLSRDSLHVRRRILIDHYTELRARQGIVWVPAKRTPKFNFDEDDNT